MSLILIETLSINKGTYRRYLKIDVWVRWTLFLSIHRYWHILRFGISEFKLPFLVLRNQRLCFLLGSESSQHLVSWDPVSKFLFLIRSLILDLPHVLSLPGGMGPRAWLVLSRDQTLAPRIERILVRITWKISRIQKNLYDSVVKWAV